MDESGASQTCTCTFGSYNQSTPWTDVRTLPWAELAALLTRHGVGPKEGACFVPATFTGSKRTQADARRIDVAVLDSDAGATLGEITAAVRARGWSAAVSSTHSHLTTRTRLKRKPWDAFRASAGDTPEAAERYLLAERAYLPRVARGASVGAEDTEHVWFEHQPCPKFRIALPLRQPWLAEAYEDQRKANAAWKERIEALAAALALSHDQACTDTSRLFYLPRRPADGPAAETAILPGSACDIFALPRSACHGASGSRRRQDAHAGGRQRQLEEQTGEDSSYTDPRTGETVQLTDWAKQFGPQFEIAQALGARRPDIFVPRAGEASKRHIRCVNEDAHTQAGADAATFVVDASDSTNRGFVYHCRHAHCDGVDRLVFLQQMLEHGWLSIADLTDPSFLADTPIDSGADGGEPELTEHGVAVEFACRHASKLRYCHTAGAWYIWSGTHWAKNETRLVFTWARRLVAQMNRDSEFKTRAVTGKAAFASAVERFAQADEAMAVTASAWDPDPWLLGTPGGVVDLRTGRLEQAERSQMLTKVTAVAPAATARCPRWLAFLHQATGGDQELIDFLQRWFGYSLTGVTREHALLFVYGSGGNGKGVLLVTAAGLLGGYATTAAMDTFTAAQGERHPTDLAMLRGARLVLTTETEEGRAWAEARIKALTGGDPITARFMRQDFFTFTPAFKLTISGNHKPTLRNVDEAARRRFNVVPFPHRPAEPDPKLPDKLQEEWPGILRWMIDGCLDWQANGLARPKAVLKATAEYFAEQDMLAQWVDERCEQDKGFGATSASLFSSWRAFAASHGEDARNAKWFGTMLERQGFRPEKDCSHFRGRGFVGLRPLPDPVSPHWQERES